MSLAIPFDRDRDNGVPQKHPMCFDPGAIVVLSRQAPCRKSGTAPRGYRNTFNILCPLKHFIRELKATLIPGVIHPKKFIA
jgi:hypothetical protein